MLAQNLIAELRHEAISTRKMLERIPADKMARKPHDKSMSLGQLAGHIADIPAFVTHILTADMLDFASGAYETSNAVNENELLAVFDKKLAEAVTSLETVKHNDVFHGEWVLRSGEHVVFTLPRLAAMRILAFSHLIHHRGQLSVYLRLLDIPVPGIYGPSADEA